VELARASLAARGAPRCQLWVHDAMAEYDDATDRLNRITTL
jgi:hypothetical protein